MIRRFSVLFAILVNSIFLFHGPVSANTEDCINKVLQSKDLAKHGFDSATQVAEIEHEGMNYHWINLASSKAKVNDAWTSSVFATDNNGLCKLVTIDISGPLPTIQDYYTVLGREVTDKFIQAFQSR